MGSEKREFESGAPVAGPSAAKKRRCESGTEILRTGDVARSDPDGNSKNDTTIDGDRNSTVLATNVSGQRLRPTSRKTTFFDLPKEVLEQVGEFLLELHESDADCRPSPAVLPLCEALLHHHELLVVRQAPGVRADDNVDAVGGTLFTLLSQMSAGELNKCGLRLCLFFGDHAPVGHALKRPNYADEPNEIGICFTNGCDLGALDYREEHVAVLDDMVLQQGPAFQTKWTDHSNLFCATFAAHHEKTQKGGSRKEDGGTVLALRRFFPSLFFNTCCYEERVKHPRIVRAVLGHMTHLVAEKLPELDLAELCAVLQFCDCKHLGQPKMWDNPAFPNAFEEHVRRGATTGTVGLTGSDDDEVFPLVGYGPGADFHLWDVACLSAFRDQQFWEKVIINMLEFFQSEIDVESKTLRFNEFQCRLEFHLEDSDYETWGNFFERITMLLDVGIFPLHKPNAVSLLQLALDFLVKVTDWRQVFETNYNPGRRMFWGLVRILEKVKSFLPHFVRLVAPSVLDSELLLLKLHADLKSGFVGPAQSRIDEVVWLIRTHVPGEDGLLQWSTYILWSDFIEWLDGEHGRLKRVGEADFVFGEWERGKEVAKKSLRVRR